MNKKLAAKIQKLIPLVGENEVVFSTSLAIEPPERELVLKKGCVYTTFDIYSPIPLNVSLVTKVINDVLYDSYYHSENISPIQSLEKAVVNINEKISSLAAEEASSKTPAEKKAGKVVFNTVSSVLWGNVLYIVQYGKGKSFLMREGEVKEVSATVEGNFAVSSGVVKNGDVVVISTSKFAEKYPPNKLLGSALSSKDLDPSSSCLILKFMVDEEFTEDEVIDFEVKTDKKASALPGFLKGLGNKKKEPKQKDQAIASLVDTPASPTPEYSPLYIEPKKNAPNIKMKPRGGLKKKLNTKVLMYVVGIMLVVSVVATLIIRNNNQSGDQEQNQPQGSSLFMPREFEQDKNEPEQPQEDTAQETDETLAAAKAEQDALNKVARVEAQPFYDIKLADENAAPSDIAAFSSTLAATDAVSGKIFTSDIGTPKFTAIEQSFPGIKNVQNYDGRLNFSDNEGYKSYSLNENKVVDTFPGTFNLTYRYLGNIYSIEGDEIKKYVPSGDTLESSSWGTDNGVNNARAVGIAYSIYVISENNDLLVYTQGNKASFTITGLDIPLKGVTDIATDVNFDYIYLADAGNNRVVLLNTDGEFVKQIMAKEESAWSDIKSISVNASETKMYILNSSKVFEVDLTTAEVAGAAASEVATEEVAEEAALEETAGPAEEPTE